jgi:Tfp pilus assembly protein FimV
VSPRIVGAVPQRSAGIASARQMRVAARVVRRAVVRDVRRARPGDRVHVVRAGESLWSIASDELGGRATVASVAREVNRLWDLNQARIATGDRDLLPVGTRLVLK